MTTKPPVHKIMKGILYTKYKRKQNHESTGRIKSQEKKTEEIRE
jgi:hypothetical protein